jgi:hypothetical protein
MFGRTRLKILKKKLFPKKNLYFIHIGKTGGSATFSALKPFLNSGKYTIIYKPHSTTVDEIPKGEQFFFCIRDPKQRFISGFYSRQRQGLPKAFYPWSENETIAFKNFSTPNELAEALSSDDQTLKKSADFAMRHIGHVSSSYWDHFLDEKTLKDRTKDVLLVMRQERLANDFEILKKKLKLAKHVSLLNNKVVNHVTPESSDKKLSPKAVENLSLWYQKEYQFINLLEKLRLIQEA